VNYLDRKVNKKCLEKTVLVYLLAFNRPEFISEAINSVLNQTYKNCNLIISDNSTDTRVEELLKKNYPNIEYIKRGKNLNSIEHQNILLQEINSEYVVFFHDDDVMLPTFIEVLVGALSEDDDLVAAAPNAEIISEKNHKKNYFHKIKNHVIISNGLDMAYRYFQFNGRGYPPFPGYIYRSSMLKNKYFDSEKAGRHSDFTFIESLLSEGKILWIPDVLMKYRIHNQSSSVTEDLRARKKLINHLKNKYHLDKYENLLLVMKFKFIHSWIQKNKADTRLNFVYKRLLFILLITDINFIKEIFIKIMRYLKIRVRT